MSGIIKPILFLTASFCLTSAAAPAAEPDPAVCQVKLELKDSTRRGIYFLDQNGIGPVPGRFETEPGEHELKIVLAGREIERGKVKCAAGKEKFIRLKSGKVRAEPAWTEQGSRFQVSGEEISFQGVGISGAWGENAWAQVLLADVRGRMDIIRTLDDQTASLNRDYEQKKDYQIQKITRSVIMFSWDAALVASRLQVEDRWLSPEGVLYSKVTMRLPRSALSERNPAPTCSNQPRLVFFDERLDNKVVDQVVILCGPGEGFGDLTQALAGGERRVWSAKDERQGRCTDKGIEYVESIGMYRYPSLLPIGQLQKDFSSENPYGCEFR
jgi:hypothetical protein